MKISRKIVLTALSLTLFPVFSFGFSRKNILSPCEGNWNNIQPLVVALEEDVDVFYSLTNSDPLESGFSYDRPVVINETGKVVLKISCVSKTGESRSDYTIEYTVSDFDANSLDEDSAAFVKSVASDPVRKYSGGKSFQVPNGFKYSLDNQKPPYLTGSFMLSEKNTVDRYVPVTMTNGLVKLHYIVHVENENAYSAYSDTNIIEYPFEILDWNDICFKNKKFIYQIDDEYWDGLSDKVTVDRSVPHVIRWQSVEYEPGNPVFEYVLNEKPDLVCDVTPEGLMRFHLSDSSYSITKRNDEGKLFVADELFADAFTGEKLQGTISLEVSSHGLCQGKLTCEYDFDKEPPCKPEIIASVVNENGRKMLQVSFDGEEDSHVMYSISDAHVSETGFDAAMIRSFEEVSMTDYTEASDSIKYELPADKAFFLKIKAYSVDDSSNKSEVAEKQVVLDTMNYYLVASDSVNDHADGSYENPFNSFDQVLNVINSNEFTRVHVSGTIRISGGEKKIIGVSCQILGNEASFILENDASLCFDEAKVSMSGIHISKNGYSDSHTNPCIVSASSVLLFDNCEISLVSHEGSVLVRGVDSGITIMNSGLTGFSSSYISALNLDNCDFMLDKCRLTFTSSTCSVVTLRNSNGSFGSSSFSVNGMLCRAIELVSSKVLVKSCSFAFQGGQVSDKSRYIWKDVDSVVSEESNAFSSF